MRRLGLAYRGDATADTGQDKMTGKDNGEYRNKVVAQSVAGRPPEDDEGKTEPLPLRPEWKVLEPDDRTDPVPHEIYDLKKLENGWTVAAASVRGKLHAHRGLWRDDAYAFDETGHWTIIAVSDGAGCAKWSRIGARIACDESVRAMKEMLSGFTFQGQSKVDTPSEADFRRLKAFLTLGACTARDEIVREAHTRGISTDEMYATLLLAVHGPWKDKDAVGALQVGDGAIGVFMGDGRCTELWSPDTCGRSAAFLNLWSEITRRPYDQRILFAVKRDIRYIAVMSDGVADDFFPLEKRLAELLAGNSIGQLRAKDGGPVNGVLREILRNPQDSKALQSWLGYAAKGSRDDRTLVLLYRH